tara:strand:- start:3328 stop:3945 length:618 start_codon:yes stop_codon:yes gene_type:complete
MGNIIYFCHIPKTAGNFILGCLRTQDTMGIVDGEHQHTYNFPYTGVNVACVRNPFDHLVSIYFHGDGGFAYFNKVYNLNSFEEFIKFYCSRNSFPELEHFWPFKNSLYDPIISESGEVTVGYCIRFEKLSEGIHELGFHNGIEFKTSGDFYKNTSVARPKGNKGSYKNFYNEELIELVNKKCKTELDLFNYDFDGPKDNKSLLTF